MKQYLKNQKGSTMMLALITIVFLSIIVSGLMPLINSQVLHSTMNNDTVEAQYAAEAGAKRAIVGIKNNRTDWAWVRSSTEIPQNTFVDGTNKYYTTAIGPPIPNNAAPTTNTDYTITSHGYVGNAHKTVVVKVTSASTAENSPFKYAAFTKGNMLIQNPQIIGDIYSNNNIKTTSSAKMVTGKAYSKTQSIENSSSISGGYIQTNEALTLDIASLIPTLAMTGTNLKATWSNGQWGNHTYTLNSGSYYYDGDYDLNGHSYNIAAGDSVTIYVKGNFNLMSKSSITGGNLTIYSTKDIYFNGGSLNNSSTKVYSNGNIQLSSNSSITNSSGMIVATGNVHLAGGSTNSIIVAGGNVAGNKGSNVSGIYANGTLTMNGATVTYNDCCCSRCLTAPWSNSLSVNLSHIA